MGRLCCEVAIRPESIYECHRSSITGMQSALRWSCNGLAAPLLRLKEAPKAGGTGASQPQLKS